MIVTTRTHLRAWPVCTANCLLPELTRLRHSPRSMIQWLCYGAIECTESARTISFRWRCSCTSVTFRTDKFLDSPNLGVWQKILSEDPYCKRLTPTRWQISSCPRRMRRALESLLSERMDACVAGGSKPKQM